jgi:hypothetical protein
MAALAGLLGKPRLDDRPNLEVDFPWQDSKLYCLHSLYTCAVGSLHAVMTMSVMACYWAGGAG